MLFRFTGSFVELARARRAEIAAAQGSTQPIRAWQEEAATDNAAIRDWWKRWPNANVGVAAGAESAQQLVGDFAVLAKGEAMELVGESKQSRTLGKRYHQARSSAGNH